MSEYISENNQYILWNAIQRVQLFHETIHSTMQSTWFKDIIGTIYMKNKHRILTATELKDLNRSTISHMVKTLQPAPQTEPIDGVIENMGELLQQQLKQRELYPTNIIAELKLEIKTLSETVKFISDELASLKKTISVPELEETT